MSWGGEYPTVAMVARASYETLCTWEEGLPKPVTDVQRTVSRRITLRLFETGDAKLREEAPEVAAKWDELQELAKKVGINLGGL